MEINYTNNINNKLLFIENIEDKEKRHEYESLIVNKDMTNSNIRINLDDIRN